MKSIKYILTGIIFGIVMVKSEAFSWYRIQEMFCFQSFYMYGIIGMAVVIGIIAVWLIKRFNVRDVDSNPIEFALKEKSFWRSILGGSIFGLGWALTGACPGPLFVILGYGYISILVVIVSAVAGMYLYVLIKDRLPH